MATRLIIMSVSDCRTAALGRPSISGRVKARPILIRSRPVGRNTWSGLFMPSVPDIPTGTIVACDFMASRTTPGCAFFNRACATPCTLGKYHYALVARQLFECPSVGLWIGGRPVHGMSAVGREEPLAGPLEKLFLGEKPYAAREAGRHQRRVEVAHVVGNDDDRPHRRDIFFPMNAPVGKQAQRCPRSDIAGRVEQVVSCALDEVDYPAGRLTGVEVVGVDSHCVVGRVGLSALRINSITVD